MSSTLQLQCIDLDQTHIETPKALLWPTEMLRVLFTKILTVLRALNTMNYYDTIARCTVLQ